MTDFDKYNLTEESLFTLLSLSTQITQAFESIFDQEDILNSEFEISQFNYHHLLNDTIHDALASQIIIKAISFIDEWNNYFGVKTETKDQETILQIKSLTKPAYSALMAWKEMNSYRNQALAHNHRDKYQKNIYLQNKKFDAPQTDDELLLVAFCIHKMSQVTSLFFQDEIIKIINILEKIIQENKNKNKGRYEFNNKCIQKIKSLDKDITNSFIHYNFTNTLLDTLRKNNSNI